MNNYSKYKDLFQKMIDQLRTRVKVHAVILFGSQARDEAHVYSDYDVLIIANFQHRFIDRGELVIDIKTSVPMDTFCYTPDEFKEMFSSYNITAIDALGDGIVLFGNDYIKRYKEQYKDYINRGMRKYKCVLINPT